MSLSLKICQIYLALMNLARICLILRIKDPFNVILDQLRSTKCMEFEKVPLSRNHVNFMSRRQTGLNILKKNRLKLLFKHPKIKDQSKSVKSFLYNTINFHQHNHKACKKQARVKKTTGKMKPLPGLTQHFEYYAVSN